MTVCWSSTSRIQQSWLLEPLRVQNFCSRQSQGKQTNNSNSTTTLHSAHRRESKSRKYRQVELTSLIMSLLSLLWWRLVTLSTSSTISRRFSAPRTNWLLILFARSLCLSLSFSTWKCLKSLTFSIKSLQRSWTDTSAGSSRTVWFKGQQHRPKQATCYYQALLSRCRMLQICRQTKVVASTYLRCYFVYNWTRSSDAWCKSQLKSQC